MTIRRGWAIALGLVLLASLAFNLFIGGLIAGARMNRSPETATAQMENRALWSRLSQEDRAIARDIARDRMRLGRAMARDYRTAMREIDDALRAEPFDAARFGAALDRVRALNEQRGRQEFEGLTQAAQRFSPEGRALIAEMRRPGLRGLLPPDEFERRGPPRERPETRPQPTP